MLSESLHHYLRANTHAGLPLVWEYMRRCISQARAPLPYTCCLCSSLPHRPGMPSA